MARTAGDRLELIHAERARLVNALEGLSDDDWRARSLCSDWSVEQVVAHQDFAVSSQSRVKGLRLEADDAMFESGSGPLVRGRMLDLVMAVAGRPEYGSELSGDGADELRRRLA